jgi:hypothetical protein
MIRTASLRSRPTIALACAKAWTRQRLGRKEVSAGSPGVSLRAGGESSSYLDMRDLRRRERHPIKPSTPKPNSAKADGSGTTPTLADVTRKS